MDPVLPCIVGLQEIKCTTRASLGMVLAPSTYQRKRSALPYLFFFAFFLGVGSSISLNIFTDRVEPPVVVARRNEPVNAAYPVPHWSPPASSVGGCKAIPVYTDETDDAGHPAPGEIIEAAPSSAFSSESSEEAPVVPPFSESSSSEISGFSSSSFSEMPLPPTQLELPVLPTDDVIPSSESSSSEVSEFSSSSSSEELPVPEPPPLPAEPEPLPPPLPPAPPAPFIPAQVGVFLTEGSVKHKDFLIETLDSLKSTKGAALVFNVKGSAVYFDSDAPLAKELNLLRPAYDIKEVIALARERGIYTIGRFIAVKDPSLAQSLPETQIHHPKTGRSVGDVWVDPSNASVITYNKEILEDLVESGIDEVNFDYIRYPTEYAQVAVGLTGQEKADHLEQFIRMARTVINEHGAKTKLGLSMYAILGWNFPVNFEYVGQDLVRFAPYVDVISPMAYPATFAEGAYYNPARHPRSRMYYLVYRTITGYAELLGPNAYKLRPWIQGYGITAKNIKDEIDAVFDAGACGFTVWNASNAYKLVYDALPKMQMPAKCQEAVVRSSQ